MDVGHKEAQRKKVPACHWMSPMTCGLGSVVPAWVDIVEPSGGFLTHHFFTQTLEGIEASPSPCLNDGRLVCSIVNPGVNVEQRVEVQEGSYHLPNFTPVCIEEILVILKFPPRWDRLHNPISANSDPVHMGSVLARIVKCESSLADVSIIETLNPQLVLLAKNKDQADQTHEHDDDHDLTLLKGVEYPYTRAVCNYLP